MQAGSARVIVLLDFASMAPLEVVISWFAKSESKSVRLVEVGYEVNWPNLYWQLWV